MGWRSVVISQPAYLSLCRGQFHIKLTDDSEASIPLEDLSAIILDNPRITISQPMLCELAEAGIVVVTVDSQHLPNGIFLPYQSYHRTLKRLRAQLTLPRPTIKRWHQQIIQQKIRNQAQTLALSGQKKPVQVLMRLAANVKSGDPDNFEGQAAAIYFRYLLSQPLKRRVPNFFNGALNYGYAVVRACIARSIVASGLHPALGLFHDNEQNAFNLADDLIEPYRPLLDHWVLQHYQDEEERELTPQDKGKLVSFLHQDIGNCLNNDQGTVLANIDRMVSGLAQACETRDKSPLWLAAHPKQD